MNLGWLTRGTADDEYARVVQHEFGHALGCLHEHQNPAASINWNVEAVYRYYMGPPNNWSKEDVDSNLFEAYARDKTQFTDFDRKSIMIYAIPPQHTLDGYTVSTNSKLSRTDIDFIATAYPVAEKSVTTLTVGAAPVKASIGAHGEVDAFEFVVTRRGRYAIETSGERDVVMTLFASGKQSSPIAEDDDSGEGLNARISTTLGNGRYTVLVRHYQPKGKGTYGIAVRPEGARATGRSSAKGAVKGAKKKPANRVSPSRKGKTKAKRPGKPARAAPRR